MKILLNNTLHGLIPVYDKDFDEKKKLKIGSIYECSNYVETETSIALTSNLNTVSKCTIKENMT
jgi:hypothetical protein